MLLRILLLAFFSFHYAEAMTCSKSVLGINPARERAETTMSHPRYVSIDSKRIETVARQLADLQFRMSPPAWNFPPYPGAEASFDKMFAFFLIVDSINYQYFHGRNEEQFSDGADIGAGLLVKRIAENWNFFGSSQLQNVTERDLQRLFAAEIPLPALRQRTQCLREVGAFLHAHRGTDWLKWLKQFRSPLELAVYLSTQMKAFQDPYLKRAQLFVGMLVGRFGTMRGFPKALTKTEGMTIYADYILPMILNRMGILKYSAGLQRKIQNRSLIAAGSREEEEIRSATILASDELLKALRQYRFYQDLNILGVDSAIWLQSKEVPVPPFLIMPESLYVSEALPHHRTLTIHY